MTLNRSLGWGFVLAFVATVATIVVGFIAEARLDVPGIVEISSTSSAGKPATEFFFNPLAPIALAVVLGLIIWSVGRARSTRGD